MVGRANWIKLIFFYLATKLLLIGLGVLLSLPVSFLWNQENTLSSDFVLNDLYYSLRGRDSIWSERATKQDLGLSGKIIFVNSTTLGRGSSNKDSFRGKLSRVLNKLIEYQPSVIAIDHVFNNLSDTSSDANNKLIESFKRIPYLVLDESNKKEVQFKSLHLGKTAFPASQQTIRRYFSDTSTFAYKIVRGLLPNYTIKSFDDKTFVINYLCNNFMELDLHALFNPDKLSNIYYTHIDADKVEQGDSAVLQVLHYVKGNAVIIGHLGPREFPQFDIEDKHFVPIDTALIKRSQSMYGAVIHANAVENIMKPNVRFVDLQSKFWFKIIDELLILLFIAFLLFVRMGKIVNLLVLFVSSFIMVYVVLYLMNYRIYIEVGLTLLQFLIFDELIDLLLPVYDKLATKFAHK